MLTFWLLCAGVRYAEPPVGVRRWRRPAPARRYAGINNAKLSAPVCPQIEQGGSNNFTGREDCLFLDIIVGGVTQLKKKPVVVYINSGNEYRTGIR